MSKIVLEGINIDKSYENAFGRNKSYVLKNQSIKLMEGESLGIVGKSGSGKSTLAKIISKLIPMDKGRIVYNGSDITHKELLDFKRKVQYISQRPECAFDPRIKIEKSILSLVSNLNKSSDNLEKLYHLMEKFDLEKKLLDRYPFQISGGEIQRFALCRALMLDLEILILDEATSMLDVSTQANIISVLRDIKKKDWKKSYVFISHDLELINRVCDNVLDLDN